MLTLCNDSVNTVPGQSMKIEAIAKEMIFLGVVPCGEGAVISIGISILAPGAIPKDMLGPISIYVSKPKQEIEIVSCQSDNRNSIRFCVVDYNVNQNTVTFAKVEKPQRTTPDGSMS